MLAQKIIIEQIIKALGKKSKKKTKDIEEKIERLFKIQQSHEERIKRLEQTAIKTAPWNSK